MSSRRSLLGKNFPGANKGDFSVTAIGLHNFDTVLAPIVIGGEDGKEWSRHPDASQKGFLPTRDTSPTLHGVYETTLEERSLQFTAPSPKKDEVPFWKNEYPQHGQNPEAVLREIHKQLRAYVRVKAGNHNPAFAKILESQVVNLLISMAGDESLKPEIRDYIQNLAFINKDHEITLVRKMTSGARTGEIPTFADYKLSLEKAVEQAITPIQLRMEKGLELMAQGEDPPIGQSKFYFYDQAVRQLVLAIEIAEQFQKTLGANSANVMANSYLMALLPQEIRDAAKPDSYNYRALRDYLVDIGEEFRQKIPSYRAFADTAGQHTLGEPTP